MTMKRSLLFLLLLCLFVPAVFSGQPLVKVSQLKKGLWQRPLFLEFEKAVKVNVERALKGATGGPLVPGFIPSVIGKRLVYRSYFEVRCVSLTGENEEQGKVMAGEFCFKTTPQDGSLANILNHRDLLLTMEKW